MSAGRRRAQVLALGLAIGLSGCARILTGTTDTIRFESRPAGAEVVIDGQTRGKTPLTTEVPRSLFGQDVTLRLIGYHSATLGLSRSFNNASLANILCLWGVALCAGVDLVTGAIMRYDSTAYTVNLRRRGGRDGGDA